MSNFLEDIAYRQYENKLPERYDEEPLFHCQCCGEGIFIGEFYFMVSNDVYCNNCVTERIAEREDLLK